MSGRATGNSVPGQPVEPEPDGWKGRYRMIAYVTVGADDMDRARRFYGAFLPGLGYRLERYHGDLSYILRAQAGQSPALPDFYVKSPFDGGPATAGNGSMVAFEAGSQMQGAHPARRRAGGGRH